MYFKAFPGAWKANYIHISLNNSLDLISAHTYIYDFPFYPSHTSIDCPHFNQAFYRHVLSGRQAQILKDENMNVYIILQAIYQHYSC